MHESSGVARCRRGGRIAFLASIAIVAALPWSAPAQSGPTDPAEVESFLDGLFAGLMTERHIPGAVVMIVKDGRPFFAKGYGFADIEKRTPVDPQTTQFRVASNSKLFTATAAMQMVEAGKLDLETDVNRYLERFQIAPAFGKPLTLANLLTHTPGFDDKFQGTAQPLDQTPPALGDFLATAMPRRVMPPGDLISYSNFGLALTGYLVERASGEPFADYVQRHVLVPLDMRNSGFGLPSPLPPGLATPYDYKDGKYTPMGYDRILWAPAGALSTTAGDMGHFMIANLQLGSYEGRRILAADTARLMQQRHFSAHPRSQGWCYGFDERRYNGVRAIGHGGDWRGFGTQTVLVPEANLGLFVSTNRSHDPRFFQPLLESFFSRYLPRRAPYAAAAPPADFATRASRYTGAYLPTRRVRGDYMKMLQLMSRTTITAEPDGSLLLHLPENQGDPLRLVEVEPLLFEIDGKDRYGSFRADASGRITHFLAQAQTFEKVAWWDDPLWHRAAAATACAVFAISLLLRAVTGMVNSLRGGATASMPPVPMTLAAALALLNLAFLTGIGFGLSATPPFELLAAVPLWIRAVSWLPLANLLLVLVGAALFVMGWRSDAWSPLGRFHYGCVLVAAGVMLVLAAYWNLIAIGA